MKHTTHFVSTRLVSLVLSLFLVFGTAASSLSAVTDLSIPDQPASAAPALDGAAGTVASATDASYGVAEGSLLAQPADDDVLDIALDDDTPAAASPAPLTLSRDKNTDLAATGADPYTGALNATSYYIGAANSNYKLVKVNNSWRVQRVSDESYMRNDYGSVYWNGTPTTFSVTNSSSGATINSGNYYVIYQSDIGISRTNSKVYLYSVNSSYIVTFNANGGTGTMDDQTISGTANLNENIFTREGYSFTGWNTAADGTGTSYADKASVTLTTSITLYAQWQQDAPPASANTLYFTNVDGWYNLKAYLYNSTTGVTNAGFPGTTMTDLHKDDGYSHDIYSIEADPSLYDYVIFSNTPDGSTDAYAQTVSIKIEDALANGAGIYCVPSGSGYETDSQGHLQVNFYTYGDKSSTGDPNPITYKKQIEKLNPGNDDYNYRLHLTVDGSALEGSTTETHGGGHDGKGLVVIIDTTETMTATSGVWDPENKFRAVQHLLQESGGLIDNFLNSGEGNTVTVIGIHGLAGDGTYTQLITEVASGTKLSDFAGDWNDSHTSHNISYVTGFLYVDDYLKNHNDEDTTVVFITGNDPMTYVSYSGGETDPADPRVTWQRGSTAKDWRSEYTAKTLEDYKKLMTEHPELTFYSVGVKPVERGDGLLVDMGEYSRSIGRGDYFSADSKDKLEDIFDTIQTIVIPGDKTSNITVTDTLSKYVDFATNKNLTATLYTDYNSTTQAWGKTENVSSLVSVTGDTVTFSRAAEIEGPFKLEIAFNIKTADGVLRNTDTYGTVRDGYPNVGDDDTDFTTATSAGKSGYYANSSATIRYTLNDTTVNGTFIKPVVQAPAETPVQGKYIFKYIDRYGDERTVEVPVTLNSSEKNGYSGNNGQSGVPTFLWTTEAQALFTKNPLVDAALALEGNAETGGENWQKDASVYKRDLVWDNLTATSQGSNVSYDATAHTVTIQATTTPYTFTLLYHTVSGGTATLRGTATGLEYGKAVTFNPIYSGSTEYAYVDYTVPSDGFSYWSADEAGNIPITTNLTYGMIMRGDYMHDNDDDRTVHIYAQYNRDPEKLWNPLIEEAKLTHTIDDNVDWVYLDYMTNYLSKEGTVVQEMETKPEYGIVVAKYDSTRETLSQETMQSVADKMIEKNKSSAYLDSGKTAIVYRFNYSDSEHISDFNRTLYTLKSNTSAAENKKFTAIAYIIVDETTYYSLINTDITVIDLV